MALKNLSVLTTQRHQKKTSIKCTFHVLSSVLLFSSLFIIQFQLFNEVGATSSESNTEKGKGTKSNGESVPFQFSPLPSPSTTTSLFDSLPLNGAFVTGKDNIQTIINRNSGLKRVRIKVRNPSHFNNSISSPSASPTVLKNLNKNVKNTRDTTTTTIAEKVDIEKEKASSLFDLLPNQGAMITTESGTTSHDQGDKNPNPRNQRSPLKLNKRFDASFSGGFEIEPQKPTSEFSLSFFNENVLPPIIKTLTQDDNPEITRLSPPVEIKSSGGYSSPQPSSPYQPPPPPTFIRQNPPPYQNPQTHNTQYKVATAFRETSSSHYKKPNSGGSTVIIYANPQSPPSSSSSNAAHPVRNSYGIPPPYFTTTTTTTAAPLPKNEIHYHYHINSNDDKLKTTTTSSPPPPPTIYGKPIGVAPPPPRNFYRAPIRNRKPYSGYGIPPPPPPPSRNTYLPPPKNTGGGGYSTPESQKGGYSSNSGQTQEETSGGYSSSSSSSTFNNQKNSYHNNNNNDQQTVPIITGNGNSERRGNSFKKNQNNLGQLNLDYTNDEGDRVNDDYVGHDDDEKFRSRTLFTINKFQEREPTNPSSSNSFPPTPSNSYGPPPISSSSSSSYGPPAPPPPSNQYGPASSPAPPLNNDNPSQTQSAQTSITLETIPITTTETRFVTVPKITQTLGGTLQQNLQNPPPNDAPSGGYSGGGSSSSSSSSSFLEPPPAPNRNNNNNNNNNFLSSLSQNPRNILSEQLLQLSPSRGGLPDFSDIETLALLQAQNNNPRNTNPQLLSEILLSQIVNGNNNNNNNFRGSGSHLFVNPHQSSADLRTLSLLNNPVTIGSGIRSHFGHQPQPFSISPVGNNNVPILNPNAAGLVGGGQLQSLRGGSTVLTGDAVGAISDLIREQRLQLAVSDLRSRLRNQHRDADRTRSNYRNLFYKGALLLAGLSLIPTVSTVVSPGLAAAAVGAGSTASSSAFTLSSSLLPLTTGRRRRDVHGGHDDDDDVQLGGGSAVNPSIILSMEKIFGDKHAQFSSTTTFSNMKNTNRITTKSNRGQLTNNTNIDSTQTNKRTMRKKYTNNLEKVTRSNSNVVKGVAATKQSLFDNMAFKGAFIPKEVRKDLEKYLPLQEIMNNSQCLQKYFCQNLLQIETFPDPTPILLLYAGLSSDVDKNPWLREAMTAAKNQNCAAFYCYRDGQQ